MKNKYTFKDCYQILDIDTSHICNWDELRKKYKSQIQRWHPDRYKENTPQKEAANNKIKNLNIAYNILSKYYKAHGFLPIIEKKENTYKTSTLEGSNDENKSNSHSYNIKPEQPKKHSAVANQTRTKRSFIYILIIMVIITYSIFSDLFNDNHVIYSRNSETNTIKATKISENSGAPALRDDKVKSNTVSIDSLTQSTSNETNKILDGNNINHSVEERIFFTNGSTVSTVIDIQGIPDKTEGNIWFYGNSEVYFKDGVVIGWKRSHDTHLNAGIKLSK